MSRLVVWRLLSCAFLLLALAPAARGQFSAESPVGVSAGLVRLFEVKSFTAKADVQVLDASRKESLRTPITLALLDGKMRMDIDMAQMQGPSAQPAVIAALKQAGLDRVSSVVRLDKKKTYLVFPAARSCVALEMSRADAEAADKNLKVIRTPERPETVGGRACNRNKVVVKNSRGATVLEATTWTAADLKNFPVQIAVNADGNTTVLRFTQVQKHRPDAALFEAPAGYTMYGSPEMLLFSAMQKQGGVATNSAVATPPRGTRPGVAPVARDPATKRAGATR